MVCLLKKIKRVKYMVVFCCIPFMFGFTNLHKYYVSITKVDYIKNEKAIQITTRLFTDDFEKLLQTRYNKNIILGDSLETKKTDEHIKHYLKNNFSVTVNNQKVDYKFLGKACKDDIVRCYLEISNIDSIESIVIKNKILFDLYNDQQNIIKLNINAKQHNYLLTAHRVSISHNYNKNKFKP